MHYNWRIPSNPAGRHAVWCPESDKIWPCPNYFYLSGAVGIITWSMEPFLRFRMAQVPPTPVIKPLRGGRRSRSSCLRNLPWAHCFIKTFQWHETDSFRFISHFCTYLFLSLRVWQYGVLELADAHGLVQLPNFVELRRGHENSTISCSHQQPWSHGRLSAPQFWAHLIWLKRIFVTFLRSFGVLWWAMVLMWLAALIFAYLTKPSENMLLGLLEVRGMSFADHVGPEEVGERRLPGDHLWNVVSGCQGSLTMTLFRPVLVNTLSNLCERNKTGCL